MAAKLLDKVPDMQARCMLVLPTGFCVNVTLVTLRQLLTEHGSPESRQIAKFGMHICDEWMPLQSQCASSKRKVIMQQAAWSSPPQP
eukprot:40555-Chlamydomonas_euryale.AAC.3